MGILDKMLRTGEGRKLKALRSLVPDINALESEIQRLSDPELAAKTGEFRSRLDNGESVDELLIEAFAVVREAAARVLGQRHYDVQLMGGAALHFGGVAEMKTGEGKTLVSTLPVYLNGLTRKGVHVVTVNDYLARRDAEWMGQVHRFLGLNLGLVVSADRGHALKKAQYACDITYGTNNEFGFDYLRDNMAMSREAQVQRGHNYVIVDEVDSILIDEARTPLIISGRAADAADNYVRFAAIARGLRRDADYEVDEEKRTVAPTEAGIETVENALRNEGVLTDAEHLYDGVSSNLVHQLQASLRAKELFHLDKDYIVADGEVRIVDEFTGRVLEGRRWSEGLHQAVEAKEGVKIKEENQTLATITLQNYFRLYNKIAGMTGTAETEAAELANTYDLQVVPIPTNKPIARTDQDDLIFRTVQAKFEACADDLVERHRQGQPVLVGTASVEHSEKFGRMLSERDIPHEVLNAKQHFREADIVTQAGQLGAVTVATNMAGRGVDVILGGNPEGLALRDLHAEGVTATTADELRNRVLECQRDHERLVSVEAPAEQIAEAAEALDTARADVARLDELIDQHNAKTSVDGERVRELGGLYVLGTERHESRRIDNQLRGRAGRQGDPGESRFYLSLEDDLMRLFASGTMNYVMDRALPEDVPIEAKMVSKAIERAQNTVEQKNAEIRKNVLKYDEVMNEQRKVIYRRRAQILDEADLREDALDSIADAVNAAVDTFCVSEDEMEWDLAGLLNEVGTFWPTETTEDDLRGHDESDRLRELFTAEGIAHYEQRESELGPTAMREVERQIMLRIIDQKWREHLYEMDYLQGGINLRAMGQKDPLIEWQREGFDMFGQMMQSTSVDFVKYVMHVQVVEEPRPVDAPVAEPPVENVVTSSSASTSVSAGIGAASSKVATSSTAVVDGPAPAGPTVRTEWEKTSRNAPCPCGSGKKFKQCHARP